VAFVLENIVLDGGATASCCSKIFPIPHLRTPSPPLFTPLLLEVNGRTHFVDRAVSAVHTCAWCLPSFVQYDVSHL
jgi:hypothetical protein